MLAKFIDRLLLSSDGSFLSGNAVFNDVRQDNGGHDIADGGNSVGGLDGADIVLTSRSFLPLRMKTVFSGPRAWKDCLESE